MHLSRVLAGLNYTLIGGDGDLEITSLCCDASRASSGSMFFCLKGGQADGHDFAAAAVAAGAVCIVAEHELPIATAQIITGDTRRFMALAAKNFHGAAIEKMKLICVVGTNGKTSTTYILNSIFTAAGYKTGVIGSNGVFICGEHQDCVLTTPDPIDLHEIFAKMHFMGVQYVIMETSAHAIALRKMSGIRADMAVFTNLSQDHLDFFHTMDEYAAVKKAFFTPEFTKVAAVNADDALGQEIIRAAAVPIVTYGYTCPSDVFAIDFAAKPEGIEYIINLYDDISRVSYPLKGKFSLYNTLAASTAARVFGVKLPKIIEGIGSVRRIDGRNEYFYRADGCRIVIDFAHTPDGIVNILTHLKESCTGRLLVVFGCGGDRDKFKRPLMARAVSKQADMAIITNDNPRSEEPEAIIADIVEGATCPYLIEPDRKKAIETALSLASAADTVAILGKGAESYQEIKGVKYPFSDFDVLQTLLNQPKE